MSEALEKRLHAMGLTVLRNVPMSEKTTLKVGGPARLWVQARSGEDVAGALAAAREAGEDAYLLGNGSNVLVRDGGIPGVVITLSAGMDDIDIKGSSVYAQAGAKLSQVALLAQTAGLSGMAALAGVPGTVGGALCMNAGCYGTEIAHLVRTVEVLDDTGAIHTLAASDMAFGYRHSILMDRGWVAISATFDLAHGDAEAILAQMREYARMRREKQPLTLPSAGSFFKRPQGHFAGQLIEAAGLKGTQIGGAQVSEMHAGFLVNRGNATARDFLDLMALIQARVLQESGIMLEPEVQIIGCDSSF